MRDKKSKTSRTGAALLIVLLIVMTITILSLGFLSKSDVELACGENMILRTQMDYLAESGLEHARGMILNDNDSAGDWTALRLPLYNSSDLYDVNVIHTGGGNYKITCDAYREKNGERIGCSSLEAELRLDPCIAFWVQNSTTISNSTIINGDVYCNGTLTNNGIINGDVFVSSLSGSGSIAGKRKATGDLSLVWPRVTVLDFTSHYTPVQTITSNSLQNVSEGGPAVVCYSNHNLELKGSVQIEGMLIVDANLTITGSGNVVTAGKNMPAILVTRDLIIQAGGQMNVNGLAVIDQEARIYGTTSVTGGLFVGNRVTGTGNINITAAPPKTAIIAWSQSGIAGRWGQADGAYFRSIKRK